MPNAKRCVQDQGFLAAAVMLAALPRRLCRLCATVAREASLAAVPIKFEGRSRRSTRAPTLEALSRVRRPFGHVRRYSVPQLMPHDSSFMVRCTRPCSAVCALAALAILHVWLRSSRQHSRNSRRPPSRRCSDTVAAARAHLLEAEPVPDSLPMELGGRSRAPRKPYGCSCPRIAARLGRKSAKPSRKSRRSTTTPKATANTGLRFAPSTAMASRSRPGRTSPSCA